MTFRLGALALLFSAGCVCKSLDELENNSGPSSCSTAPCAAGYTCGADFVCHKNVTGGDCSDGATRACGMDQGECEAGKETCSGAHWGSCVGAVGPVSEVCDGKDNDCNGVDDDNAVDSPMCPLQQGVCAGKRAPCGGSCTAASYGADYEATETRCDGKDNDCNGATDVGLRDDCSLQAGACMGTQVSCVSGMFPMCTATVYSVNPDYEAYETRCDGKDNDCDGRIDAWAPFNVSNSAGHSRNAAAVASPTVPGDIVVMWEEEVTTGNFKLRTRVVKLDGTMSTVDSPANSVNNSFSSAHGSLAADGTVLAGAWTEQVSATGTKRVMVATLSPATGVSTISDAGAIPTHSGLAAAPDEVAIAVDGAGGRLFVAVVLSGGQLSYTAFPAALEGAPMRYGPLNGDPGVTHVRVAFAGNQSFWMTYVVQASGVVKRCLVNDNGQASCAAQLPVGRSPAIAPTGVSGPFTAASFWLQDVDAGVQRVGLANCADGGTCSTGSLVTQIPQRAVMDDLRVCSATRATTPTFFSWDESSANVRYSVINRTDGGVFPPGANPGHRPTPVFTGTNQGAIVFDSDGITTGGIAADEVFIGHYCF